MPRPNSLKSVHFTALDGVRGLAVLMVMFFHFFQRENFLDVAFGHALTSFSRIGQTGVDLFFALSGFLITGILIDAKGSAHFLKNFYARRILRILPLQYVALAFIFFLPPLVSNAAWVPFHQQLWGWLYATNLAKTFGVGVPRLPEHFWSLAVEEHFYLVWPAVVLLCTRRGLYRACMICIGIGFISRVLLLHFHMSVFFFTLTRLDGLAVGAWIAIFVRGPLGLSRIKILKPLWLFLGSLLVLAPFWLFENGHAGFTGEVFKYFLVAVFYGSMLLCVLDIGHPRIGKAMSNHVLTTLGKYSYGLYVWDSIIQGWLHPYLSRGAFAPFVGNKYLLIASCMCAQFATTFLAALLSWHLFEKHFLKLKRFFRYGERVAASEPIQPATVAKGA